LVRKRKPAGNSRTLRKPFAPTVGFPKIRNHCFSFVSLAPIHDGYLNRRRISLPWGSVARAVVTTSHARAARANDGASLSEIARIGRQHHSQGRFDDAIASLEAAVALAQTHPGGPAPAETLASLQAQLANAFMARGDLGSAAERYEAALRLAPDLTACWCNLGNVRLESGRAEDASSIARHCSSIPPIGPRAPTWCRR
jgi:tetratricopeptide (TPR) repeat protein